jgi:hypothetical protein
MWNNTVSTALVGTDGGGDTTALLDQAAAHALRTQAGAEAAPAPLSTLPGALDETRPVVSEAALTLYKRIVREDERDLLNMWMGAVERQGTRLPASEVALAMIYAHTARYPLAPVYAGPFGERGGWLAENTSSPEALTFKVMTGRLGDAEWRRVRGQRDITLARFVDGWRYWDAAAARDALLADLDDLRDAKAREAAVACLEVNLSDADEDALETLLDYKNKGVRQQAAELLCRLPDSAYVKRQTQLAEALTATMTRRRLEIALPPKTLSPAMVRDGLDRQRNGLIVGLAAQVVANAIAAVPLGYWEGRGFQPEQLIKAANKAASDEPLVAALVEGLRQAIRNQGNEAWAEAWIQGVIEQPNFNAGHHMHAPEYVMVRAMNRERLTEMLRPTLAKLNLRGVRGGKVNSAVGAVQRVSSIAGSVPWDYKFSEQYLDVLVALLEAGHTARTAFPSLGSVTLALHPTAVQERTSTLVSHMGKGLSYYDRHVEKLLRVSGLVGQMMEVFGEWARTGQR